jgi:hypothetical protein
LNDQQQQAKREVPQIAHVIAQVNHGALADEAAALLADLVQQVSHVGRKGTLTLTLEVKPFTGNSDTVQLSGKVSVTPPSRDPHAGIFFFTDDGALSRNDPRQPSSTLFDVKEGS